MKLIQKFSNSSLAKTSTLVSLVSILAVIGPFVVVSAGFWDAISHLQKAPEFFWSIQHIVVYTGVAITFSAAIVGTILLLRNSTRNSLKNGIILVLIGSIIQMVSGYADSLSHDVFGIDGLISWSHQPLEFGLIVSALGGFFILKNLTWLEKFLMNLLLVKNTLKMPYHIQNKPLGGRQFMDQLNDGGKTGYI